MKSTNEKGAVFLTTEGLQFLYMEFRDIGYTIVIPICN